MPLGSQTFNFVPVGLGLETGIITWILHRLGLDNKKTIWEHCHGNGFAKPEKP
jgi:hypothetical protein